MKVGGSPITLGGTIHFAFSSGQIVSESRWILMPLLNFWVKALGLSWPVFGSAFSFYLVLITAFMAFRSLPALDFPLDKSDLVWLVFVSQGSSVAGVFLDFVWLRVST